MKKILEIALDSCYKTQKRPDSVFIEIPENQEIPISLFVDFWENVLPFIEKIRIIFEIKKTISLEKISHFEMESSIMGKFFIGFKNLEILQINKEYFVKGDTYVDVFGKDFEKILNYIVDLGCIVRNPDSLDLISKEFKLYNFESVSILVPINNIISAEFLEFSPG